ncbi:alkylmercury lyase [Halostella sp. JP-L12]|uniref:organomercurial lyase n=1 Tax=Halostella TaxID=1843185 RepID=UPI000EF79277|nr:MULTISPECIES: organomercurial lyase [Halostella]NHN46074.1 alkylmercury lyase [Halostella sp. JP-L12]
MADCNCCDTTEQTEKGTTPERSTDGGLDADRDERGQPRGESADADDGPVVDRPVPDDVGRALGDLFGTAPPTTFGDWVEGIHDALDEEEWWPPRVRDLCHDADGKHLARTPTQSYRFTCVLDAFVVHALVDEPVTVESAVPGGGEVTARVTADGVAADPPSAVLSFGVAADPENPDDRSPAVAYGQTCPYVHAFPTREAYESWDESTPEGVTTALPLSAARELAVALVEGTGEA